MQSSAVVPALRLEGAVGKDLSLLIALGNFFACLRFRLDDALSELLHAFTSFCKSDAT
jgi:hypothetical protein